ncbi:MAG: hypothetical protein LBI87_09935 [Candidatus Accumulibacter sp.]|jgi:hypothetical protein|nr:hypothetical protein [Accumulibacter sp.]
MELTPERNGAKEKTGGRMVFILSLLYFHAVLHLLLHYPRRNCRTRIQGSAHGRKEGVFGKAEGFFAGMCEATLLLFRFLIGLGLYGFAWFVAITNAIEGNRGFLIYLFASAAISTTFICRSKEIPPFLSPLCLYIFLVWAFPGADDINAWKRRMYSRHSVECLLVAWYTLGAATYFLLLLLRGVMLMLK